MKKTLLFLFFGISVLTTYGQPIAAVKPHPAILPKDVITPFPNKYDGKFNDGIEVIRVTTAADIAGIAETQADVLLVVDRATTVAAATLPFPAIPRHRQVFGVSTRVQITALTLDDGPNDVPISGYTAPFQLNANTVFWRIYDEASNRWFVY